MTDVTVDALPPESTPVEPAPADPSRRGWFARMSDRLNPILVREVHQALNGKAFVATAALALLAILTIALVVASEDDVSPREGAEAFLNTVYVLIPILMFIVPFQAFFSMRSEVGGGTVEHLLMSRLSPASIVRGKLLATTVQFAIYLAIFSPLLAMTFLLRGVDVPTIAVMLTLCFIMALACSALAIACGALCRWRAFFRVIPFAIVLIGLGWITGGAIDTLEDIIYSLRRSLANDEFFYRFMTMITVPLVATILFAMIGASALAHPYENRSTRFRIFAVGFVVLVFGWTIYNYNRSLASSSSSMRSFFDLSRQLLMAGSMCGMFLCLFPFFAATESPALSPRVRRHVPRSRLLAALVAPLLPGCGRGLVFTVMLSGLVLAGARWLPGFWSASPVHEREWYLLLTVWLYITFFSAIGCFVRNLMPNVETRNWWARAILPALLLFGVLVPLLVSVGGGRSIMTRWSPLHLFNPFFSLSFLRNERWEILGWLISATVVLLLINLPTMVRGIREVMVASRNRRNRAR